MKKLFLILLLFVMNQIFGQVVINPSSTISCTEYFSSVNFSITSNNPPFSIYAVPSCSTVSAYSLVTLNPNPTFTVSCATTFTVKDNTNSTIGIVSHSVSYPNSFTVNILPAIDTICKGTTLNLYPDYSNVPTNPGLTYTVGSSYSWWNGAIDPQFNIFPPPTSSTITTSPGCSNSYSFSVPFINSKGRSCTVYGFKTIFVRLCSIDSSSAVTSSCNASDSIKKLYEADAARLSARKSIRLSSTYRDSIKVQNSEYNRYLKALIAVYNATALPATDTVTKFPAFIVHTRWRPEAINNLLPIYADSNLIWMKNLRNNVYPTGNLTVDGLITTYNLQNAGYSNLNSSYYYHKIMFKTDTSLNMALLSQKFSLLSGFYSGYPMYTALDNKDIMDTTTSDPHFVELQYQYKWNDCPSICGSKRIWTFRVYNDCKVQYMGVVGNPLPIAGIKEIATNNGIKVFPNPCLDKLTIEDINTYLQISIANLLGQRVMDEIKSTDRIDIDFNGFPPGIYFVRVRTPYEDRIFKVIKN